MSKQDATIRAKDKTIRARQDHTSKTRPYEPEMISYKPRIIIQEHESHWPNVPVQERRRLDPVVAIAVQIINMLDMPDDKGLNAMTGCKMPVFEYIYSQLLEKIKGTKNAPLFTISGHRASDPPNTKETPPQDSLGHEPLQDIQTLHSSTWYCSA